MDYHLDNYLLLSSKGGKRVLCRIRSAFEMFKNSMEAIRQEGKKALTTLTNTEESKDVQVEKV
ncbi:hypothetical protein [Ehrlichia japonica]|uniref:hypothetical protein n=1 Tax=Ehrlichia japonica TaxID=391036 RepID=UPI0005C4EFD3|nr:hypothetical protein [Ehrlichia japonica]